MGDLLLFSGAHREYHDVTTDERYEIALQFTSCMIKANRRIVEELQAIQSETGNVHPGLSNAVHIMTELRELEDSLS